MKMSVMKSRERPIAETADEAYRFMIEIRESDCRPLSVRCYWNLKKKMWSVKYRGKVVLHAKEIHLCNAFGYVSQAGRRQVLKNRRKNVHAYVVGDVCLLQPSLALATFRDGQRVTYNPYKYDKFVCYPSVSSMDLLNVQIERLPWMGDKVVVMSPGADVRGLSNVSENEFYYVKKGRADDFV